MKTLIFTKEDAFNAQLNQLKQSVQSINDNFANLNSMGNLTVDEVAKLITKNNSDLSSEIMDAARLKVRHNLGIDESDNITYEAQQMIDRDAYKLAFRKLEAIKKIIKNKDVDKNLFTTPYITLSETAVTVNEVAVKEYFTVYATNENQTKALDLYDNILKECKQLVALGIDDPLKYITEYQFFNSNKETIIIKLNQL